MNAGATTRDLEAHLSANPASPLFARLAEQFLRNGEVSRAERLCERGLEIYPHYPTAMLVYSRCLAARGRYAEALDAISDVASRYPGNIVLGGIESEWQALEGEAGVTADSVDAVFTDLDTESAGRVEPAPSVGAAVTPDVHLPEAPPAAAMDAPPAASLDASAIDAPSARRDDDAEAGVPAPMPVPSAGAAPVPMLQPIPASRKGRGFIGRDRIISRTLAEIYASQGAIGEAVETYRMLLDRFPDERESLEGRLKELEERLRNEPGERPPPVE